MRMGLFNYALPPQEGHPVDQLLALLGNAVQFVYSCWDRIVLNGYIERLQRPENLIYFFHDIVGVGCIEPAVLEQRTNAYKAWVRRVTDEWHIPVMPAPPAPPRGQRKEDFVQPFYRRLKTAEQGIACVLTSLEQGRTFVSYTRAGGHPVAMPTTVSSRPVENGSCTTTGTCSTRSWGR
jgi:hypothetical protein